jgi:starvation-inducible DNA-binding protein
MTPHSAQATAAPPDFATPTYLRQDEAQAVRDAINPLIADALALYVKTKNYHWHVSGTHFRDYHLLFDEQAASILSSVDVLAERVRKIGGTTIRSIAHIVSLQTIEDDDDDAIPAPEMIRRLIEDNRRMAERQRAAIEICSRNRDSATESVLETVLDETERRVWFLFEVSRD